MASLFPATSIDSFTSKVDGTDYPSAAHINDLQNAVVAVQTKVGINNSAVTTSLDYLIKALYPIGTVYTNYSNATNPATLFGFGTWVAIAGRVVVGLDATQTEFDTAGETGGAKTHALSVAELAAHTHVQNQHRHNLLATRNGTGSGGGDLNPDQYNGSNGSYSSYETPTNQDAGSGTAHNNLQPYVTCYVWRRSA